MTALRPEADDEPNSPQAAVIRTYRHRTNGLSAWGDVDLFMVRNAKNLPGISQNEPCVVGGAYNT